MNMAKFAPLLSVRQSSFPDMCPVTAAVTAFSNAGVEERGAVFTRREVVEFILDLSGYTTDRQLHKLRLLEPAFGDGDFLLPAIERLLASWSRAGRPDAVSTLAGSIRAVELHGATFEKTRARIIHLLIAADLTGKESEFLANQWLIYGDFLLIPLAGEFDVVVGNPPYVRQEMIPDALMSEYRARYTTIYDRADLYVPFIERSLTSLSNGGQLGFICADRWMKNRYGAPLRKLVADHFHLKIYVDMVDTPAFLSEVVAYPAITIIAREKKGVTRTAYRPQVTADALSNLSSQLLSQAMPRSQLAVSEMQNVTDGSQPWILDSSGHLALVRRLENTFPTIEEAGCKVGIGVATGADKAFIGRFDELHVEPDRKLPLVMTRDIMEGDVRWRGFGVVNPFGDDGRLVDLQRYPKLRRYLEDRKEEIAGRHVAQKAPANWYRTIDRIYPELVRKPKLLIPDIKGEAHIVYEKGELYPHHNLYFITSENWDLRALQAVLLSGIARLFIATYSTRMRGGYLRFQAQYLRRIRVPDWSQVSQAGRQNLVEAAESFDVAACNEAVFELYGLSSEERAALRGNGD